MLKVISVFPVDSSIELNNPVPHEVTFEPRIAALMYLIANKNADIKQNDTPAPLLLISHTPLNKHFMLFYLFLIHCTCKFFSDDRSYLTVVSKLKKTMTQNTDKHNLHNFVCYSNTDNNH
jgi:hypothetical protein